MFDTVGILVCLGHAKPFHLTQSLAILNKIGYTGAERNVCSVHGSLFLCIDMKNFKVDIKSDHCQNRDSVIYNNGIKFNACISLVMAMNEIIIKFPSEVVFIAT